MPEEPSENPIEENWSQQPEETPREKAEREAQEALEYLREQAKEVIERLSEEELESLKNSLITAILKKNYDLRLNDLYGAICTIKDSNASIEGLSINAIHSKAKIIHGEMERKRESREYAEALKQLLDLNDTQTRDIFDILVNNKSSKYHELLTKYFKKEGVSFDDTITYNRIYLNSLVEKDPKNLGTYDINGKQITLLSLRTMDHLKGETVKMKHCIGNSEFYINKIIKGEIMAISLRDSNNEPLYTIEYDIKTRTIKQFKGVNDTPVNSLPESCKLVMDTLKAFVEAELSVDRFSEGVDYCIYKDKNGAFHDLDNDKLTLDFFRQNREFTFIKGFLKIEDGVTEEELKTIAESGIDVDVTDIPNDLKDTLTIVRGSLVDKSVDGLTFKNLKEVGGGLDLGDLTSAEGLTLPKHVGGDLDLRNLTSAEGLTLPEHIGEGLYLNSLTSAEGLTLPENIGGYLDLSDLTSAEGLTLPKHVGGGLYLNSLTSAEGLTFPEYVGGYLYLNSLTSAEGLTLPEHIGGDLYLNSLTSAEGLTLPENVGGGLDLGDLISAEGLTLPKHVGGDLDLRNLTSAEGLVLPTGFKNRFYYRELPESEVYELRERYPEVEFIEV